MGLSHSKAHPRVIKVAPLQNKELSSSSKKRIYFYFLKVSSPHSTHRLDIYLKKTSPPILQVPRAMYFDIPLEQGETSIIKRHPPRRLQKLEPIDLPQVITSERILSQREPRTTHKAKELEKKMQIPMYTSGKRQYLHKMQMLEINRKRQEAQVELKKSLHREAKINKEKPRDSTAKKILDSIPRDDDDFLTVLPDETLNPSPVPISLRTKSNSLPGFISCHSHTQPHTAVSPDRSQPQIAVINGRNSQNAEFLEHHSRNDYGPRKIGKMETWLREQEARGQLLWDSSSSDSDELGKVTKKPRALVKTRTERIPPFDEFFDRE
uniref:Coiled-coil domain containing 198 n=1 Tax=Myotis lucifugus TaxID=59463 RepID=G1PAT3_MYOLU